MGITENGGSGRDVLLVHGNSLSAGIWTPQIEDPELKGLRVAAVDLPGHGKSPWNLSGEPYLLERYAEAISDLVRTLTDPVIVGHSLGGHVCMRVMGLVPDVRGVLLLGAPPMTSAADMSRAFLPTPAMTNAFKADLSEDDARTSAEVYTWPGSSWIGPLAEMIMSADPRVRSDLGQELMSRQWSDEHALIRGSDAPVCMVHGQEEPSVSLAYLRSVEDLFWERRVRVLEGCGHSAQLQRPDLFSAVLLDFISSL